MAGSTTRGAQSVPVATTIQEIIDTIAVIRPDVQERFCFSYKPRPIKACADYLSRFAGACVR